MEEIVQTLFEDGVLQRNGAVKLARSMNVVKVPATVQAVLVARIDRLPAEEKELLQTLAVLGREFSLGLVQRVTLRPDQELERMLSWLQAGEFIYEQPAVGDTEYIFKHALTQEVAYNSVLLERRRQLHERTGAALETLYTGAIEEHLDELARHYSRSANLQKAAQYLRLAGQQAGSRTAYTQALTQLKEALELLRKLPADHSTLGQELMTQIALAGTLISQQGPAAPAEAESSFLRARAIAAQLSDHDAVLRAVGGLRLLYRFRGEYEKSRVLGEEALATAQAHRPEAAGGAHFGLGETLLFCLRKGRAKWRRARID
jgi:predicted ATPase